MVPEGSVNFAFIGQFAESKERDTIFTTEYSVRTPMEAVYTLLDIERPVPEVYNSTYDVRKLLSALNHLRDGKEFKVPGGKLGHKMLLKRIKDTEISQLLAEYHIVEE